MLKVAGRVQFTRDDTGALLLNRPGFCVGARLRAVAQG